MKVDIGLPKASMEGVHKILTNVLANSQLIYLKLRKFHWNIVGPDFVEYHELFQEQYTQVEEAIDEIAERIGQYGFMAIGTTSEFAENSDLEETPGKNPDSQGMLQELVNDHETIIKGLRKHAKTTAEEYEDDGTTDFLIALMQSHEKMAWKIRRYLRK